MWAKLDMRILQRLALKISGQIGEPGETEKLTFVSLMHPIDSGLNVITKKMKLWMQ